MRGSDDDRLQLVRRTPIHAWLALVASAFILAGCKPRPSVPPAQMRAYELSLAVTPHGAFAAWHGGLDDGSAIFVQKIDSMGHLVGPAMQISDGKRLAYEPDLILAGDRMIVAWYEKDPAKPQLTALVAGVGLNGAVMWKAPLGDRMRTTRNPVVRVLGSEVHVAWIEQSLGKTTDNRAEIWHQTFSLSGRAETPAEKIGDANRDTWNLNATVDAGRFIVSYDAALGTKAHELQMVVLGGGQIQHRLLSPDDGKASLYPDLQISGAGEAALTWFDEKDGNREVYLLAAPLDALGSSKMERALRVTRNKGESIGAYVAWNGPTVGLAWSDEVEDRRELFSQMFDATGSALGQARQLGKSEGRALVPAIRASGSGFLIAWNDYVAPDRPSHGAVNSSKIRLSWIPIPRE